MDPDGMWPWPSLKDIQRSFNQFKENLPKVEFSAKMTLGAQAGVTIGKLAKADLTVFSLNIAESKISSNKGKITKAKSELMGFDTRTGKSDGIQTEHKIGASLLGTAAEGGFEHRLHGDLESGPYTTGTKSVVKLGGLLSESSFQPNLSSSVEIDKPNVGGNISKSQVTESRFGDKTKYIENSFSLGWKALLGVEVKFTW